MREKQPHGEHVIIHKQVFLYQQKAPFVRSGESIKGAIEYDRASDQVRCHECGDWFFSVAAHITISHGITARDYKWKHGLCLGSALIGEQLRATRIQTGLRNSADDPGEMTRRQKVATLASMRAHSERPNTWPSGRLWHEQRNIRNTCQSQLLKRLTVLSQKLGRTPTRKEIKQAGISPESALMVFNVDTLNSLISLLGLRPNPAARNRETRYSREVLIELLRDFFVANNRLPARSDWRRGLVPSHTTFRKYFGGLPEAYDAAGLSHARRYHFESEAQ